MVNLRTDRARVAETLPTHLKQRKFITWAKTAINKPSGCETMNKREFEKLEMGLCCCLGREKIARGSKPTVCSKWGFLVKMKNNNQHFQD